MKECLKENSETDILHDSKELINEMIVYLEGKNNHLKEEYDILSEKHKKKFKEIRIVLYFLENFILNVKRHTKILSDKITEFEKEERLNNE